MRTATKRSGWQQTGFRADKELLTRFRSKLASENRSMGPVIEDFIKRYVEGHTYPVFVDLDHGPNQAESEVYNAVIEILRGGGKAADILRGTTEMLQIAKRNEKSA